MAGLDSCGFDCLGDSLPGFGDSARADPIPAVSVVECTESLDHVWSLHSVGLSGCHELCGVRPCECGNNCCFPVRNLVDQCISVLTGAQ